jgi:hypothetical protein
MFCENANNEIVRYAILSTPLLPRPS